MNKSNIIYFLLVPIGAILGCIIGVVLHFYHVQIEKFSFWQQIVIATVVGLGIGLIVRLIIRWNRLRQKPGNNT